VGPADDRTGVVDSAATVLLEKGASRILQASACPDEHSFTRCRGQRESDRGDAFGLERMQAEIPHTAVAAAGATAYGARVAGPHPLEEAIHASEKLPIGRF
jgi:hypothetical protein